MSISRACKRICWTANSVPLPTVRVCMSSWGMCAKASEVPWLLDFVLLSSLSDDVVRRIDANEHFSILRLLADCTSIN